MVSFSIDQSNGVTAVSEYLKKATIDNFPIKNDIEVIHNFVDTERFKRQDKDHFRKMITGNGEKILIHTSNFRKVKRIGDVLEIFAQVRAELPARLLMVGDGPERSRAESMCREMSLCQDISFLGSQNAVEEIYSIGDLFLIPSGNESFGLAALEAMACSVPVISSEAGGLPELVLDGVTGYTSPIGDVQKMGQDALRLLKDDEMWNTFSKNAREHAEKFSLSQIVPKYESYYASILEGSPSVV